MEHGISPPAKGPATALGFSALAAVALHAGLLFGWNAAPAGLPLSPVVCNCVDVTLVDAGGAPSDTAPEALPEAAAASPFAAPVPEPPTAEQPPVATLPAETADPMPESLPEEKPLPVRPQPVAPKVAVAAPSPSPVREPVRPAKTLARTGAGGASSSGLASGSAAGGGGANTLGKPVYLLRPTVQYPAESRSAGEQGVVVLRITVNAGGRPVAVSVGVSSGFSRLDRAAVEGGWRCRVSNAFEGAQFEAPLRFNLKD